jgi:hypothetical protein
VQEVALAQELEIFCGPEKFDWHSMRILSQHVKCSSWNVYLSHKFPLDNPKLEMVSSMISPLTDLRTLCIDGEFPHEQDLCFLQHVCGINSYALWILIIINKSSHHDASNARDVLYGMLGIAKHILKQMESQSKEEPVDLVHYDITVSKVSLLLAAFLLTSLPFLAFLSLAGYREIEEGLQSTLPSWAMDLGDRLRATPDFGNLLQKWDQLDEDSDDAPS